jgi:hypothetical protein
MNFTKERRTQLYDLSKGLRFVNASTLREVLDDFYELEREIEMTAKKSKKEFKEEPEEKEEPKTKKELKTEAKEKTKKEKAEHKKNIDPHADTNAQNAPVPPAPQVPAPQEPAFEIHPASGHTKVD